MRPSTPRAGRGFVRGCAAPRTPCIALHVHPADAGENTREFRPGEVAPRLLYRAVMRTNIVALVALVLVSSFAHAAAAQGREAPIMVEVRAASPAHGSVAPHLTDETMALEAPSAGDYVLPIVGAVLGGAATLTGLLGVLGSAFVLDLHDADDGPTNAGVWLGGSAALAALGALSLGFSIAELRNLHHRANEAEAGGVEVIQFTPTASGGVVGVGIAGTF
jgi:hypothetical protein